MKKALFVFAVIGMALAMTGCKTSKEDVYRKAYEKAKAQDQAVAEAPVVAAPVVETPVVTPVTTQETTPAQPVAVRTENLTVVDGGSPLLNYSVVIGAFSLKPNAEGMTQQLKNAGYDARLVYNSERNLYRVVASTFNTREEAVKSRDQIRAKYPDAWLLYQK